MSVTAADVALGAFTFCNLARVFAYAPQIVRIGRDPSGAAAISYSTWALFTVSNFSTVLYAILVVADIRMAAIFLANTCCCAGILGLTMWKRRLFQHPASAPGAQPRSPKPLTTVTQDEP